MTDLTKREPIDSWDIFNLSPRTTVVQSLYVGLTWSLLVWGLMFLGLIYLHKGSL
jgi:hypothetical protein